MRLSMKVTFKDKVYEVEKNTKIKDLLKDEIENSKDLVIAIKCNNELKNLNYEVEKDCNIELVDLNSKEA